VTTRASRSVLLIGLGAGVTALGAVLAVQVGPDQALAIGGVGVAIALAGLAAAVHGAQRRLAQQVRLLTETRRRVDRTDSRLRRDAYRTRSSLDSLPSDVVRLDRAVDALAPGARRLPGLGGWAVTTATLLTMLDEVHRRPGAVTVLECGSGTSTLFLALAIRERGLGGRVVALESDPVFAEQTRRELRAHDVGDHAVVVDAPLVDVVLPGEDEPRLWFDLGGLPADLGAVDLLLVDAPVGSTSVQARYPGYPMLRDRLAPGALVVLDDTDRPDEAAILDLWLALDPGTRRLERIGYNTRSTFLRVDGGGPFTHV
jgi:predicted O-methyltransferase YrrM